jgi:hypothetical protein
MIQDVLTIIGAITVGWFVAKAFGELVDYIESVTDRRS